MDPVATGRYPDFVIVGTMKSGTTTLFRWLEQHPRIWLPATKEPTFFSDVRNWERGVEWYGAHFAETPPGYLTGEASVAYTDPLVAERTAARMTSLLPESRLVCLLRDPIARLRSHYRHEVQRSRESQPFTVAIGDPDNPYVRRSMYASALTPYLDRFGDQVLVVSMEALTKPPHQAWFRILDHIGVSAIDPPGGAANVTASKQGFTRPMLFLWKSGVLERMGAHTPTRLRSLGKRLLLRDNDRYRGLLATANQDVPEHVVTAIRKETAALQNRLGVDMGFDHT